MKATPGETIAFEKLDEIDAVASAIWWFEARNVIVINERRGRLLGVNLDRACELLSMLPVEIDREPET